MTYNSYAWLQEVWLCVYWTNHYGTLRQEISLQTAYQLTYHKVAQWWYILQCLLYYVAFAADFVFDLTGYYVLCKMQTYCYCSANFWIFVSLRISASWSSWYQVSLLTWLLYCVFVSNFEYHQIFVRNYKNGNRVAYMLIIIRIIIIINRHFKTLSNYVVSADNKYNAHALPTSFKLVHSVTLNLANDPMMLRELLATNFSSS